MNLGNTMNKLTLAMLPLLLGTAMQAHAQTTTKTETIEYHDDTALWVLGQTERTTVNGIETSKTDYGWMALPVQTYAFGKLQQIITYDSSTVGTGTRGTIKTVSDGRDTSTFDTTTTFTDVKRGIPQSIVFGDGSTKIANVNDLGQILAIVDESGATTCYDYDPMGRIKRITHPSDANPALCDTSSSEEAFSDFAPVATDNYGISTGHWVQTTHTGTGYKVVHFDALWRPLVAETYDSSDPSSSRSITVTRYDADGRVIYQSYPTRTLSSFVTSSLGTWTWYDALGRPKRIEQDSELGHRLVTTIDYLTGFQRKTTDPKLNITIESFQAFDQPTFDAPVLIDAPENQRTTIARDVFGKPTSMTRGATP
jgi:YD repeat-containing protein